MAQLGRFDHRVPDTSGNAISGASVTIYREGATVNGNQSGTSPITVTVRHRGKIAAADTVFINTTTGTTYSVDSVTATTVVLSGFGGTLNLTSGDRIIPSNSQPTLYGDDQGGATTSNPLTTSATGRAQCFMEFGGYDVLVSGGGATSTLFSAQVTPTQAPGQIRYADEFGSIQKAIDDLPAAGGTVWLSAGTTYSISAALTSVTNLTLRGADRATTIILSTSNTIKGIILSDNTTLRDFTLRGTNVTQAGSTGIDGGSSDDCLIDGLIVEQWGGIGISLANNSTRCRVTNNTVRNNKSEGIYTGNAGLDNVIRGNVVYGNTKNGIDCNSSRTIVADNICRNNGVSPDITDTCGIIVGHSSGNTSTDNVIIGNICDTNVQNGIFIWGAGTVRRYTVANNICINTTDGWGIELVGGTGATFDQMTVTGNVCRNNAADGIAVNGVSDSTFTGNMCHGNAGDGMQMFATNIACARNTVTGNVFRSNTGRGFLADHASVTDCIVTDNIITGNGAPQIGTISSATNMVYNNSTSSGNLSKGADITAAATITLGNDGDFFFVTGNTNITSVTASWSGRMVTLKFTGTPTFTDGSNLILAGNLVATADDTITIRSDGTNWIEVARSVN